MGGGEPRLRLNALDVNSLIGVSAHGLLRDGLPGLAMLFVTQLVYG